MTKTIEIQNVPSELHAQLEARAADARMSLSDYLLATLRNLAPAQPAEAGPGAAASIAVLPFENVGGGDHDDYFSAGITDDIIARLGQVRNLRVIASGSTHRFKGRTTPMNELRAVLGVSHVLSGSVQRDDERLRVVVRLDDAEHERNDWTETYDRELDDIFAVQSVLASSIAEALESRLGGEPAVSAVPGGTASLEAYDLFLRARYHVNERTERGTERSIALLEQALRVDPRYATAWSELADAYLVQGMFGSREPARTLEKARAAAQNALRIEPALGEATAALACVTAVLDWRWSAAEALFQQAIQQNPANPITHQWYALNLLLPMGRFAEARAALTQAWGVDPLSPIVNLGAGILAYYRHDFEAARDVCWSVIENDPGFAQAHYFIGLALEQLGDGPGAIQALESAVTLSRRSVETTAALAHAHASFGNREAASDLADELYARAKQQYVSPVQLAAVELGRGQTGPALKHLENALAVRATDLIWMPRRPVFDVLRTNPTFAAIVHNLGLPAGQASPRAVAAAT